MELKEKNVELQNNKNDELKEDKYVEKKSRKVDKDKKNRDILVMFYCSSITCVWNVELGEINHRVLWIPFCWFNIRKTLRLRWCLRLIIEAEILILIITCHVLFMCFFLLLVCFSSDRFIKSGSYPCSVSSSPSSHLLTELNCPALTLTLNPSTPYLQY